MGRGRSSKEGISDPDTDPSSFALLCLFICNSSVFSVGYVLTQQTQLGATNFIVLRCTILTYKFWIDYLIYGILSLRELQETYSKVIKNNTSSSFHPLHKKKMKRSLGESHQDGRPILHSSIPHPSELQITGNLPISCQDYRDLVEISPCLWVSYILPRMATSRWYCQDLTDIVQILPWCLWLSHILARSQWDFLHLPNICFIALSVVDVWCNALEFTRSTPVETWQCKVWLWPWGLKEV